MTDDRWWEPGKRTREREPRTRTQNQNRERRTPEPENLVQQLTRPGAYAVPARGARDCARPKERRRSSAPPRCGRHADRALGVSHVHDPLSVRDAGPLHDALNQIRRWMSVCHVIPGRRSHRRPSRPSAMRQRGRLVISRSKPVLSATRTPWSAGSGRLLRRRPSIRPPPIDKGRPSGGGMTQRDSSGSVALWTLWDEFTDCSVFPGAPNIGDRAEVTTTSIVARPAAKARWHLPVVFYGRPGEVEDRDGISCMRQRVGVVCRRVAFDLRRYHSAPRAARIASMVRFDAGTRGFAAAGLALTWLLVAASSSARPGHGVAGARGAADREQSA